MKTTDNIVYKFTKIDPATGHNWVMTIRLNDECNNGHIDFSITGEEYENEKRGDRHSRGMGAIGDRFVKVFPEFQIFYDLHLCTTDGAPMYAVSNGFYHLKNSSPETARNYVRATESEFEILRQSEDATHFQYLIEKLGIADRWKNEATKAIKMLEEFTGLEFNDTSKKMPFVRLGAKLKSFEKKIESGYYSTDNIARRNNPVRLTYKQNQL